MNIGKYPTITDEEKKIVIGRIAKPAAIAFELISSGELAFLDSGNRAYFDHDAYWSVMDYGASQGLGAAGLTLVRKYSEDIAEQAKIDFETDKAL